MIRRFLEIPLIFWLAVAAGMGYWDYYQWQSTELVALDGRLAEKKNEAQAVKGQTTRAEDFKRQRTEKLSQIRELGEKFRSSADRLPRSARVPDLLKALADLSDKTGLEFSRFRPQPERKDVFLVVTPLEVSLRGTYLQIMSFLDATSHITRVVTAERLSLDNPIARGNVSVLSATATLLAYYIDDSTIEGVVSSSGAGPRKDGR